MCVCVCPTDLLSLSFLLFLKFIHTSTLTYVQHTRTADWLAWKRALFLLSSRSSSMCVYTITVSKPEDLSFFSLFSSTSLTSPAPALSEDSQARYSHVYV